MHIPLYETEILWGRKGKVITVYTADGGSKEFGEFYDALGEAVSECYCELTPSTIQKLEYINETVAVKSLGSFTMLWVRLYLNATVS